MKFWLWFNRQEEAAQVFMAVIGVIFALVFVVFCLLVPLIRMEWTLVDWITGACR